MSLLVKKSRSRRWYTMNFDIEKRLFYFDIREEEVYFYFNEIDCLNLCDFFPEETTIKIMEFWGSNWTDENVYYTENEIKHINNIKSLKIFLKKTVI